LKFYFLITPLPLERVRGEVKEKAFRFGRPAFYVDTY